tara:strand:+ start:35 stop:511 length:477 start_codon:yes stop_codon:yes gene_type:complete
MMFFEIKVRVNGEEKWANGHKVFKYLLEEYSKVSYKGRALDPYNTRINTFYDNIPQALLDAWKEAYPNVNIKQELGKCKAWLLSNTNKAKKDFRRFTNNWLAKAMENGGQIPINMSDKKLDQQIAKRKKYEKQAQIDSAPQDWVQDYISDIKNKIGKK